MNMAHACTHVYNIRLPKKLHSCKATGVVTALLPPIVEKEILTVDVKR